jgi:4-amino-4-deoxy-L-arabinose transferase-like glycosyltransferase
MLQGLAGEVMFIVQIAVLLTSLYAFVHAALQRPDAYTAAEKLTKPVWLLILGAGVAMASILSFVFGVLGVVIAACAAGVYLVDVRPKLLDIQGKSH